MTEERVPGQDQVREVVVRFLRSVGDRDLDAAAATLAPGITWANVPSPPTRGREAVIAMLASIIDRSERVRWDVISAAYADDRAHLERLDRFWIDGVEYAAPCHGVFRIDSSARIVEVRDYVDLGEWRARLAGAARHTVGYGRAGGAQA